MSPYYPLTILILTMLGMALGLLVVFLSIRGRMILGQSRCAHCGYQLGPTASATDPCTECGAKLDAKNAVQYGTIIRSRKKIALGIGIILFAIAFPVGAEVVRLMVSGRILSTHTGIQENTADTEATWMRPMDETPNKRMHWQFELEGVSNDDLIISAGIRPQDEGIWTELHNRNELNALSSQQIRNTCSTYAEQIRTFADSPRGLRDGIIIDDIFERGLDRLDSTDPEDRKIIERMILPHLFIDIHPWKPIDVQASTPRDIRMGSSYFALRQWQFEFTDIEVTLDGESTGEAAGSDISDSSMATIVVPGIPWDPEMNDHVLSITPTITLSAEGEESWTLTPTIQMPINVLAPGEVATVYHEYDELPEYYTSAFGRTKVSAWQAADTDEETIVSIEFLYPGQGSATGSMDMTIATDFQPSETVGGNALRFSFGDGWMSSSSSLVKTYRTRDRLEDNAITITLEPVMTTIPTDSIQRDGLLGNRILLEDLPVQWVDRSSSTAQNTPIAPRISCERIGHGDGAEATSVDGPLFGPTPITSIEDTEAAGLLADWLDPALLSWTDSKGKRWAQLQYGGSRTLPINSRLSITFPDQAHADYLKTFELTSEETSTLDDAIPGRGAYWLNPIGEDIAPGTTVRIHCAGLPGSVRRDNRNVAPWFGGAFELEIPVVEGSYDEATRYLHPAEGKVKR